MLMLILSRRVSLYPAPYLPPPSPPTVARVPSHGLPNPWGQPATLQRSPKADLLSSLPNTQVSTDEKDLKFKRTGQFDLWYFANVE